MTAPAPQTRSSLPNADLLREGLGAWIPRGADAAIVDVPVHRNAGDLFIYAVTEWLLADMGCRIVYRAGVRDYRTAAARRRIHPRAVVIGLGGGNFGDLYPEYQALRERVVVDFPANRIVVLPQSIHFSRQEARQASIERLRRHPDLRIAVRDRRSLAIASDVTPHVRLLPDVVDAAGGALLASDLGPAPHVPAPRTGGTVYLLRGDRERAAAGTAGRRARSVAEARSRDWPALVGGFEWRLALAALLMPAAPAGADARVHAWWQSFARESFRTAVGRVRRFDRVVTDRLHGAIVARLAGRPVTLVDNSYGKLSAYHDAWWRDDPAVVLDGGGQAGLATDTGTDA